MPKNIYTIPKMPDSNGFTFLKVGRLQGKKHEDEISQYKQVEGHLHMIEFEDRYELHVDTYMSIHGPIEYMKHGLLEITPMYVRDRIRGVKKVFNKE